jgi:hypothetical protein
MLSFTQDIAQRLQNVTCISTDIDTRLVLISGILQALIGFSSFGSLRVSLTSLNCWISSKEANVQYHLTWNSNNSSSINEVQGIFVQSDATAKMIGLLARHSGVTTLASVNRSVISILSSQHPSESPVVKSNSAVSGTNVGAAVGAVLGGLAFVLLAVLCWWRLNPAKSVGIEPAKILEIEQAPVIQEERPLISSPGTDNKFHESLPISPPLTRTNHIHDDVSDEVSQLLENQCSAEDRDIQTRQDDLQQDTEQKILPSTPARTDVILEGAPSTSSWKPRPWPVSTGDPLAPLFLTTPEPTPPKTSDVGALAPLSVHQWEPRPWPTSTGDPLAPLILTGD